MKNLCHCQDDCSWGEDDGHSSNVLAGLDCWIWHSGRCDAALIDGNNIMAVPLLTDFLWKLWLMMDSNITCDEDLNKHVTRIQIQHVTRIRIQHVTRIRIKHVTRIWIQHVIRIDLVQGWTQWWRMEGKKWTSFCPDQDPGAEGGERHTGNTLWRLS